MNKENRNLFDLIDELTEERDAIQDRYLRSVAEFDNYRKRTQAEKAELIKTAGEKTILSILPILDDLDRALESTQNINNVEDLIASLNGYKAISKKLNDTLERENLEKFDPTGEDFNSDFHEAISIVSVDPSQSGKVIQCVQPGYRLSGKIIRYAKVIVGQ